MNPLHENVAANARAIRHVFGFLLFVSGGIILLGQAFGI
jgi:hypothetical protein